MRNFSMKKFGTPRGAGPASASEKVGLSIVGVPSLARVLPFGSRVGLTSSGRTWPSDVPVLPLGLGLAFSPPEVIGPVACGWGATPGFGASVGAVCWLPEVVGVLGVEEGAGVVAAGTSVHVTTTAPAGTVGG